jgi:anhydro-N-acetylmuramic acid kinase
MNLSFDILGIMSGTSLDGVDLCLATFQRRRDDAQPAATDKWHFDIQCCQTVPYSDLWRDRLAQAHSLSALEFVALHKEYGALLGQLAHDFLLKHNTRADYIASHGHTVFHQPQRGITFQLGDGNALAAAAQCSVIYDFRGLNVALGGQGAPLVPVGDAMLFGEYEAALNLGGFANISYSAADGTRTAFDVCPCNIALNHLCRQHLSLPYDHSGKAAAQGNICTALLQSLNALDFYAQQGVKSLGREWVEEKVLTAFDAHHISVYDKLCTVCEHVATQVAAAAGARNVMATGGGAHNEYLMQRLAHHCKGAVSRPQREIIDFKEALIFAFLGALYVCNEPNCLASACGGADCVGGAMVKYRFNGEKR